MSSAIFKSYVYITAIFVYISKVTVRLMVLHGAKWYSIIRPSAIFVYILRHLFTYKRLKLGAA